ncbi:MAG: TolB family protein, partial [Anaerolineae bacterium]
TPSPLPQFKRAYTRWNGSTHSIWVANLDGSDQRFLLDFAASPAWSPDGKWIAFFGEEGIDTQEAVAGGTNGIWIMSAEGQQPTRLLPEGTAQSVAWSPDGRLIAFDAARGGPDRRIYFIDPVGSPQPFETLGQQPSFSSDGAQVVAQVCRPRCGLWIQNLDDTAPHQLTTGGSDGLPAWSPDGNKIAFSRNVDDNVDIYVINADGTGLQQLTTAPGIDSVPAWTPDGRQIAFRTTRNGLWQIFVMDAGGANQHLIIDNVGASEQWAFDRMSIK